LRVDAGVGLQACQAGRPFPLLTLKQRSAAPRMSVPRSYMFCEEVRRLLRELAASVRLGRASSTEKLLELAEVAENEECGRVRVYVIESVAVQDWVVPSLSRRLDYAYDGSDGVNVAYSVDAGQMLLLIWREAGGFIDSAVVAVLREEGVWEVLVFRLPRRLRQLAERMR